eukprot:g19360.t1
MWIVIRGEGFGVLFLFAGHVYYWSFGGWRYRDWRLAVGIGSLGLLIAAGITWVAVLMFRRKVPCRRWLALSFCLWAGGLGGLWAGDQNYGHHMISFYTYQDLVSYTDVDPAAAKGQSYMDSGEVYFKEGTTVDTSEMVSFRNRVNFCAAPILGARQKGPLRNQKGLQEVAREGDFVMPQSGTVDFWAVGTNCCDKATREFTCGEAGELCVDSLSRSAGRYGPWTLEGAGSSCRSISLLLAMCSFLVSSWLLTNLTYVNFFMRPRGPDLTTRIHLHNFTFVHNLLHMTGERIPQPFVSDDQQVVVLYNGEIYNFRSLWPDSASDGEALLPLYLRQGHLFPRLLDGEFALALLDFRQRQAVISTDIFSTKPLWFSTYQGFHVASYQSALVRMGAAFASAVQKRVQYAIHPMFIGLSSGYDSGAIHVALVQERTGHFAYTVFSTEDMKILQERIAWAGNWTETNVIVLSGPDLEREAQRLAEQCEPFHYRASRGQEFLVSEDPASSGLSFIMQEVRRRGILVYLSGTGADEIISDYGHGGKKIFPHSNFGGFFPDDLRELFPWEAFFLGTQRDYLMKEELVAGVHGVEARYPFLDRMVVQEFLWLSPTVKNAKYKAPEKSQVYTSFAKPDPKADQESPSTAEAAKHSEALAEREWALAKREAELQATEDQLNDQAQRLQEAWRQISGQAQAVQQLKQQLESRRSERLFLVSDGMDVIFNDLTSIAGATSAATDAEGASRLIVERYEAIVAGSSVEVVFSSERLCPLSTSSRQDDARYPPAPTESKYLNAGGYLGPAAALLRILRWVLARTDTREEGGEALRWKTTAQDAAGGETDQYFFKMYFWEHPESVTLDYHQSIFGNFVSDSFRQLQQVFYGNYRVDGCALWRQNTLPITWHGNGAGKWLWLLSLEELSRSCPFIANLTVQRYPVQPILDLFDRFDRSRVQIQQILR